MSLALQIKRDSLISAQCSRGALPLPDGLILRTLELPWIYDAASPGGAHFQSCVPLGLYDLVLHDTVHHPRSFALVNPALGVIHLPDLTYPDARTVCLLHIANKIADLLGCIGLGMSATDCWISDSRIALDHFNAQVPWVAGHTLEILQ